MNIKHFLFTLVAISVGSSAIRADKFEPIKYGDFEQWVTRKIPESKVLGGKTKTLYEIAPTHTVTGNKPYVNEGGSPWATSNVLANVMGVVKGSNAVFPDQRSGGNKCVKLTTIMEHCKAVGIINVDVLVAGSIFLGQMVEPVKSTSDPLSKLEMGIPFNRRPKALMFDYKVTMPTANERTYSSGFGKKKTLKGRENAEVFIILQRRWEDKDGNIFAKRVGTGRERFNKSTGGWVNGHRLKVNYGDISKDPNFRPWMGLLQNDRAYYARNSKGKMVPVQEVGWDAPNAIPTHILVMASASSGKAYEGTLGLTMWLDNVGLVF